MKPGTILYGGSVETMRAGKGPVNSLVYHGGSILAVGNNLDSDSDFSGFRKVNLHGAALYPGFVDAHTHFCYYALSQSNVDLSGVASLSDALNAIKSHTKNLGPRRWIVGGGLQVELFAEDHGAFVSQLPACSSF